MPGPMVYPRLCPLGSGVDHALSRGHRGGPARAPPRWSQTCCLDEGGAGITPHPTLIFIANPYEWQQMVAWQRGHLLILPRSQWIAWALAFGFTAPTCRKIESMRTQWLNHRRMVRRAHHVLVDARLRQDVRLRLELHPGNCSNCSISRPRAQACSPRWLLLRRCSYLVLLWP